MPSTGILRRRRESNNREIITGFNKWRCNAIDKAVTNSHGKFNWKMRKIFMTNLLYDGKITPKLEGLCKKHYTRLPPTPYEIVPTEEILRRHRETDTEKIITSFEKWRYDALC